MAKSALTRAKNLLVQCTEEKKYVDTWIDHNAKQKRYAELDAKARS